MKNTVNLGDVLKTSAGGTPLKSKKNYYQDGKIKWLLSGAVNQKEIFQCSTTISEEGLKNSSAKIFPVNTVLVAMYGATAGQVGILRIPAATNQAVCGIYPSDNYLPEYLFYYLTNYKKTLLLEASGVAQPNLSQIKIKNIPLPIVSIPEQQRIVAKLDAVFAEIDKMILLKKRSISNLDKLFLNQLNNFFLNNSNNWESTTLGAYYDVRDGTHESPKYVPQGIPLVTSKNLKDGKIDLTKIKYIKNEDYLLIKKRSGVSMGDVLMAMIGTIGNPVIIKNDNHFAIKNVALFKVKEKQSSNFLKYYLDSAFVKNKMMKDSKGTTQQFVGLGYLRNFPIKVPSFEQQQGISLKIISLEKNVDTLKKKYNSILKNYISLKNSLLTELLNKSKAA